MTPWQHLYSCLFQTRGMVSAAAAVILEYKAIIGIKNVDLVSVGLCWMDRWMDGCMDHPYFLVLGSICTGSDII